MEALLGAQGEDRQHFCCPIGVPSRHMSKANIYTLIKCNEENVIYCDAPLNLVAFCLEFEHRIRDAGAKFITWVLGVAYY